MGSPSRDYWEVHLTFNYEECMAAVHENVLEEAQVKSIRYAQHEESIEQLAFHRGILDQPQMHAYSALMLALSELESVVLDRLWAGGLAAALQTALAPGFSVAEFWQTHLSGWRTKACETALSAAEDAYNDVKARLPAALHERLAAYRDEKLRGTRLLAETMSQHGFEFGRQVLAQLGYVLPSEDAAAFYYLFPSEMDYSSPEPPEL